MDRAIRRQMYSSPLFMAGLAAFGLFILAATYVGILNLYVAFIAMCFLIAVAAGYPEQMLMVVVVVSILIPLDATINPEKFPRIGPTRVVLAATLIGLLLRSIGRGRLPSIKGLPFMVPVGLYLAWGALSATFSLDSLVSFNAVIGRDIVEQFLLFYIMFRFLNEPSFWPRIRIAVFAATAVVCAVGILESITLYNPYIQIYERAASGLNLSNFSHPHLDFRAGLLRIRSSFFHPIALGCFINLIFPIVLAYLLKTVSPIARLASGILAVAMLVTSFLTLSRAPWLCLLLEVAIIGGWWCLKDVRRTAFATAMIVFAVSASALALTLDDKMERQVTELINPNRISLNNIDENSSEFYRIALVKEVVDKMHGARWIYGYGPNAFYLAGVTVKYASHKRVLEAPDNNFIRILLEYGAGGLFTFCLLMAWVLSVCIRRISLMREEDKLWGVACVSGIAGFILVNFTVSMFNMFPLGSIFWILVARIMTLPLAKGDVPGESKDRTLTRFGRSYA